MTTLNPPAQQQKRVVVGIIFVGTCLLSAAYALVLVRSAELATLTYVMGVAGLILFVQPFVGLLNYVTFVYVRPQEFIDGFVGVPVMMGLGAATLGATLINQAFRRKSLLRVPQDYLMIWFFVAIIISNVANLYIGGATDAANQFMSRLVLYFLVSILVINIRRLNVCLYAVTLLTLFQAVAGIVQFHTGKGLGGALLIEGRIKGIGIFSDPNDLALTFLIVLPFLFFKLAASRALLLRILLIVFVATLLYGLYLTESRGGLISFLLVCLFLFSRRYGYRKGFVGGFALAVLVFAAGPGRMTQISATEETAVQRTESWAAGLRMFQNRPVFGVGAWRFTDHHGFQAHNSFVQCAAELGVFGALAWVLLIFVSMKNMYYIRNNLEDSDSHELVLYADAVFYGLIAFVSASMFITRTYNDLLYILLGLAAAITNIFVDHSQLRFRLIERKDLTYGFGIMMALLALIKLYVFVYW